MGERAREKIVKFFLKIGNFFYVQPLKMKQIYDIIRKNIDLGRVHGACEGGPNDGRM